MRRLIGVFVRIAILCAALSASAYTMAQAGAAAEAGTPARTAAARDSRSAPAPHDGVRNQLAVAFLYGFGFSASMAALSWVSKLRRMARGNA